MTKISSRLLTLRSVNKQKEGARLRVSWYFNT